MLSVRAIILAVLLAASSAVRADDAFLRDVKPKLDALCLDCHGGKRTKSGVDLAPFTNAPSLYRDPKLWESVARQIEERQMPPDDKPQPTPEERLRLVESLRHLLDDPDPASVPRDPGATVARRLNRTEYNFTIRDLLGVDSRPADRFPADGGGGGGFDNNADTLFVPPILLERYLQAAESVLAEAKPERLSIARPVWHRRDRAVAGENLAWFAARAYRRPLEAGEVGRLLGLYDAARKGGMPFALALRSAYKAVLVSPNFLFRVEREQPGGKPWRISDHELASRLSYFIWSSMPDEELLVLATAGTLSDPGVLEAQVRRMLRDPKASALAGQFTAQWLGTKTLSITSSPDRSKFPRYTDTLRDAMMAEPVEFFGALLRDDASLLKLLDADFTYANAELAALYGITNVTSTNLVRVPLPDRRRGGILGMAAVLTQTSYPLRTSPVLRGKWILEEVLGTPPPPPPPLVKTLSPDDKTKDGLTFRQRLEEHRKDPNCAGCHSRMDPLGFALENFDAIGGWRTESGGAPVDASGVLVNGEKVEGPVALKNALLARRALFLRHLTEKMLAYALGRGLEHHDIPAVRRIVEQSAAQDHRTAALVLEVVQSYPFQWRRGENPPKDVAATP